MSAPDDRGRRVAPADIVDVFVYVIVLNLAAEFIPSVIAEGFGFSVLTAVLLKVVLEVVLAVKDRLKARFHAASTRWGKAAAASVLWLVAVGSKFVVLKIEDVVFGDAVSLGGFFSVMALIAALLIARALVRRLLDVMG